MTARVHVTITTTVTGGVLAIRDEIQKLNPAIDWLYDDALDQLEMHSFQKWWDHEEQLNLLSDRFPDLGLDWEVVSE